MSLNLSHWANGFLSLSCRKSNYIADLDVCMKGGEKNLIKNYLTIWQFFYKQHNKNDFLHSNKLCTSILRAACFSFKFPSEAHGWFRGVKYSITTLFFFFFFPLRLCCIVCGILVPWPGVEPVPPAVEVWSQKQYGTTIKTDT